MASLSPVTAGRPVGEVRFVRMILLPVHQTSHRRVFHDSDHAECDEKCRRRLDRTDSHTAGGGDVGSRQKEQKHRRFDRRVVQTPHRARHTDDETDGQTDGQKPCSA